MMAEIILTPLLQVIFEKLANPVLQKFADYWELDDRFKKLQRILPIAQAVIQDAEERQTTEKSVMVWLTHLKDAACKAEDLLEEFMYKCKHSKQYPFNFTKSRIIFDDLEKVVLEGLNLPLAETNVVDRQFDMRETSSFVIGSEVIGREVEKGKIKERLLMPSGGEENVSVISIVGIPGIGKSTLAQMVYNDDEVKRCFDLRIWVFVSRDFKVKRIIKAAIESITGTKCDLTELDGLQSKLWNVLHKKKYLLVLDDVWNEDEEEWDKLRPLFSSGVDGSRVLVTTRCQKVAMLIGSSNSACNLKGLCEEDSWALFKKRAFVNQKEEEKYDSLVVIGKEIVRKCRGVPLATKVLGGLMRFKREEKDWLNVQKSEIWDLGVYRKGIFPALILSYLHLPPHLKHCFAFCSIFPKGYEIPKDELIHMWMAQGFIPSDGGSEPMEDIGEEYFNELLWMSMLEECEGGCIRGYKMHEVFYSLARFISENEFLVIEKGLAQRNFGQVRHASLVSGYSSSSLVPVALKQVKHLRTLLVFSEGGLSTVPSHIFSSFIYLRMLKLSGCLINLPESISGISMLRYLDLSNSHFHELPFAISSMYSLEVLNLYGCYNLRYLPPMGCKGLRHLNLSGCEKFTEMPQGIKDLVHLRTLPIYIVPIDYRAMRRNNYHKIQQHKFQKNNPSPKKAAVIQERIAELKNLNLKGELKIKRLERVHDVEEAKAANLMDKECLQSLGLCWGHAGSDLIMNPSLEANGAIFQERKAHTDTPESSEEPESSFSTVSDPGRAWEILESLQPHKNLKKLFVVGYPGLKITEWALPNLTELVLMNCGACLHLPILGHLPLLSSLRIEGFNSIMYIGQEIHGEKVEVSFPSLQELVMRDFPVLQEWASRDGTESFTNLRKLTIIDCPNLVSIPCFPSVDHLELRCCSSIALKCLENLTLLSSLVIEGFNELLCLPDKLIRNNHLLKSVRLSSCPKLRSLTPEFGGLKSLTFLSIRWCHDLLLLCEEFEDLTALEFLEISDCHSVKTLHFMESLRSLQDLSIENCSSLDFISFGFQPLTALKHLTIMYCPNLAALPNGLENLTALMSLSVISCPLLASLPEGIKHVKTLGSLEIHSCPRLVDLPEWLDNLISLRTLAISDCHSLKSLPVAFGRLSKLQHLTIQDCPDLQRRCQQDRGEDWWKIARVPRRYVFSSDPQQNCGVSSNST
ncbi:hypothetical protein BUALT_Bualt15G0057900 [Buddleja alternifolia]|uniref:Uncharacterized protein n=1 Tax=Buddleja alternifolia TaxID=168488 RepID=A0AAV6WJI8_9LAMI|nr:hypothetical protein BUALT_Bualt15G0057900 [Buddleja alternifolia]